MKPRVVHLVGADLGGAEKQLVTLLTVRNRSAYDHEVLVVREGPLVAQFQDLVPTKVLRKDHHVDLGFWARLVLALRQTQADILHAWTETPALWGPSAARAAHIPHVVVAEVALQEWKRGFHLLADRVNYRLTDRVVGNAAAVVHAAIDRGARPDRTRVIPLGVDLPAQPVFTRDSSTIVLLGRFDYRKGHDVLIEAVPRILAAHPEARFVLAGPAHLDDEKAVRARIVARVAGLGLTDVVSLPGPVQPTELLRSAAVLTVPSSSEGMPNVVLEAMAHGLPVIASRVGGIPDVLVDGQNGWLVQPGSVDELADAIVFVLGERAERERRAGAARATVEGLSTHASMTRWEDLYAQMLSRSGDHR